MEYNPVLVPLLQLIGAVIFLTGVFWLILLWLTSSYGEPETLDAEFEAVEEEEEPGVDISV
jgi:hypothetical protein